MSMVVRKARSEERRERKGPGEKSEKGKLKARERVDWSNLQIVKTTEVLVIVEYFKSVPDPGIDSGTSGSIIL